MLLSPDEFSKAFERIKRTSLSHSTCKLVIFVSSLDVDAICASKMLTILLKKHLIVFQLIPVVGYSDMKAKYLKLDDSITNLILIGCGSMVDLESFLEIDETELIDTDYHSNPNAPITPDSSTDNLGQRLRKHIYIIDGHRPWNLDNLFGSHVINCFDDGSAITELQNEKNAYEVLLANQEEEEEEEFAAVLPTGDEDGEDAGPDTIPAYEDLAASSDEEAEREKERVEQNRKTKRGLDSDSDSNSENEDEEEDDDELLLNGKRRRLSGSESSAKDRKKRMILEHERAIESYYSQGTTVSTSCALQVYSLITEIGESSVDYLWLGIIGSISLSAAYSEMYENIVPQLKHEVNRLHQTDDETPSNDEGRGKNADNNQLTVERDYPLFLLRHWNLYNAFFYSNYVNSKYQLYTSDGAKRLKTLFAKMGISLASANQSWHYLDINIKKKLNGIFGKTLVDSKWKDFFREGFFRQFGFHGSVSASDYFESLTALLEYDGDISKSFNSKDKSSSNSRLNTPDPDSTNSNTNNGNNNNNTELGDDEFNDNSLSKSINKREAQFISNFWKSFDSLNDFELILKGLKISKLQQKFIFDKGFEIFQKKLIKNFRIFRLVVLKDDFGINNSSLHSTNNKYDEGDGLEITTLASNTRMFQNPLILKKLGNWLLDSCAELEEDLLPLVIASLDPETDTYMVIGLPPKYPKNLQDDVASKDKLTVLNTFSLAFQEIANTTNTKTRIDSFESCIIEVKKEDLQSFLEKLSLSGLV